MNKLITEDSFIWSDLHLGHKNILKFEEIRMSLLNEQSNIPLLTQHNDYFINTGNEYAQKSSLFNLGDFSHNSTTEFLKRIKGNNILLRGNHDNNQKELYEKHGIKVIDAVYFSSNDFTFKLDKDEKLLCAYIATINGIKILFSHFPILDDNPYDEKYKKITEVLEELYFDFNCQINIHGHTHSKPSKGSVCYNVSVESLNFKPKLIKDILNEKF